MEETNKAEYIIEVSSKNATNEDLDRMTRNLLSELKETDIERAYLVFGGPKEVREIP